ncbi:MAG TPA: universal stress protein [Thermodesulfovibrio thiophilus]|uniref:universal stress protein n=1 Tax=Thermodesulfovibrio thiophilus TaxID=340095 RepID=UPI0004126668|nr:universal stress protein [Thermodesulfovibrio thiophilus]HOA83996.1 universal stress protein [Thermodesulfovibrio thiophilus]HQA04648.1 universal stress protein [Thermodesulfovibrio thiophilus]HQD37057.1 universal stress protein [Thermodesulfovibrio thiophilus]
MLQNPFKKVLLPVDKSEHSKRAVKFAGLLLAQDSCLQSEQGEPESQGLSEITLFYVITGKYLSNFLKQVNMQTQNVKDYEIIREKCITDHIKPLLDDYEKILKDKNFKGRITQKVEEGDPGSKIIEVVKNEQYSTVIMSRRGMSELKCLLLGSVSTKVLYGLKEQNIYIVGQKIVEGNTCPIPDILVPVDGSESSMKAVEHAASLARFVKGIKKITILRVINVSVYLERMRQGINPEEEASEILMKAQNILIKEGISQDLVQTKTRVGFPAEEINADIQENNYNLVIMGRRGRSPIKDIVLGGVSSAVINNCSEPTVAIINL